jgi:hypothetical protein
MFIFSENNKFLTLKVPVMELPLMGAHRMFTITCQTTTHVIQTNQATRCNNFSSLLLEVYVQLNMFRASSRPSAGAQQLQ